MIAAANVHRLVSDRHVLEHGITCCWVDEEEMVCSAHTDEELVAVFVHRYQQRLEVVDG